MLSSSAAVSKNWVADLPIFIDFIVAKYCLIVLKIHGFFFKVSPQINCNLWLKSQSPVILSGSRPSSISTYFLSLRQPPPLILSSLFAYTRYVVENSENVFFHLKILIAIFKLNKFYDRTMKRQASELPINIYILIWTSK